MNSIAGGCATTKQTWMEPQIWGSIKFLQKSAFSSNQQQTVDQTFSFRIKVSDCFNDAVGGWLVPLQTIAAFTACFIFDQTIN